MGPEVGRRLLYPRESAAAEPALHRPIRPQEHWRM